MFTCCLASIRSKLGLYLARRERRVEIATERIRKLDKMRTTPRRKTATEARLLATLWPGEGYLTEKSPAAAPPDGL